MAIPRTGAGPASNRHSDRTEGVVSTSAAHTSPAGMDSSGWMIRLVMAEKEAARSPSLSRGAQRLASLREARFLLMQGWRSGTASGALGAEVISSPGATERGPRAIPVDLVAFLAGGEMDA
jgi:hypothetical protein